MIEMTEELADLVLFMSSVAMAIRMHTPYRHRTRCEDAKEHGKHVLWLADSIHHFDELAESIKKNDIERLGRSVNYIISRYKEYRTVGGKWVSDPMETFKERPSIPDGGLYDGWVLEEGLRVLERIKKKVEAIKNG